MFLFFHKFFFLCLFSFVYVVSGNETGAIRSKLLLESYTEMISLLELLLLFFGERPLSLSDLQNSQNVLAVFHSHRHYSTTSSTTLSHTQSVILLDPILLLAMVLIWSHRNFRSLSILIYWFSLHLCQNHHALFVTQHDNKPFPSVVAVVGGG